MLPHKAGYEYQEGEIASLDTSCRAKRPWQLLLFSARTETALDAMTDNLRIHLEQHPKINLADVAYTLQVDRKKFEHRRFIVCSNHEDALNILNIKDARVVSNTQPTIDRPIAFLLPGVGEQYPGMARELYEQESFFRQTVNHCCHLLRQRVGLDLLPALFPAEPSTATGQPTPASLSAMLASPTSPDARNPSLLTQTALAQPAVFVIEYALACLLQRWGLRPCALIGYSLGEYTAACLAGVLSLENTLLLVARRAQLIQDHSEPGAMLAVPLSEEAVRPYLGEQVDLAIINHPNLCVLAGPPAAVQEVEERLARQKIASRRLPTTHAFHSRMLQPLQATLRQEVERIERHAPQIPYLSNVTGTWITAEQAQQVDYWGEHMCQPVRFAQDLECLLRKGEPEAVLLEVGPGQALSSMARQHPACGRERMKLVLTTLPSVYEQQESAQRYLLTTLGKLWLAGVTLDWHGYYEGEQRLWVPLPTYPSEGQC